MSNQPTKMWSGRFRGHLNLIFMLGLSLALCVFPLTAQTSTPAPPTSNVAPALVTFFSNPFSWATGLPGQKSDSFHGKLFVDHDQLANMHEGHFITISFVPGTYEFTATTVLANGPAGGAHLKLDLTAHHHYYVELRTRPLWPVTKQFGIRQVACEEALGINARDKPLAPGDLLPAAQSNAIAENSFPTCPETN